MHQSFGRLDSGFQSPSLRIAWVTPDYPPDPGGVSDHSSAMVGVLREAGHRVLVYARPHHQGYGRATAEITEFDPQLLVVAYVPLGYAPHTGGISPAFVQWACSLRRRFRCKTLLLAHEASLPALQLWRSLRLKLALLGSAQVAQFAMIASSFDAVLFSNIGTRRIWSRVVPHLAARMGTLRICSNIPYTATADAVQSLTSAGFDVPETTVLFFGTGHQSILFDYVEAAFAALSSVQPNAVLIIIGMSAEKLRTLHPSLMRWGPRVRALGYLQAPLVSLWLQVSTLVLAPLIEGVSARKGTVMAAFQHGRAVVTTRGPHTQDDIPWDDICVLSPLEQNVFAARTVQALTDSSLRDAVGLAAREDYDAHASARVTALSLLAYATQS